MGRIHRNDMPTPTQVHAVDNRVGRSAARYNVRMSKEQVIVGVLVVLLCVHGLWKHRWLLDNTKKGQWLVRRFGVHRAAVVLRVFFAIGLLFGLLLATNVIRPIHW